MKYVLVEHLNRPGDVVECDSEMAERPAAQVYHFHSTLEVVIVKKGWVDGLVGEISGRMNGEDSTLPCFQEDNWQCGFGSFSQFSTQFRRQVGMSPGEYQSSH